MRLALIILVLASMVSCKKQAEKKSIVPEIEKLEIVQLNKITTDSVNTSFPVRIGNDKGSVLVTGERTYNNQKLTASNFSVSLVEIADFPFSKQIKKSDIFDINKAVVLKDTINSDYLDSAIIKNIEFDFVRSNTLYFNAVLENPTEGKEIIGRFDLFYRTKKKGILSGWVTEAIKETSQNIK